MVKIKVVNKSGNKLPEYKTIGSAGCDIAAWLPDGPVIVEAGRSLLIPTGLYFELPIGFEVQIRPRSGLALKNGITVLNGPGTIDADYRGEVGVLLYNSGEYDFEVCSGDRIAQMVIAKHEQAEFEAVDELENTDRADGGWGHTGVSESEKMVSVDEFLQSAISEEIVQRKLNVDKLRDVVRNGKVDDIDREDFKKRIAKIMLMPETEPTLNEIAAIVFDYTDEEFKDWQNKMEKYGHKDNKDIIDKE